MSAKPENERREEIVNLIATAAMVCVTPHLKHMISFNTLCEAVSAALPPLPQQGEWPQDAGHPWRGDLAEALTMTGCTDLADLIDMANVGQGLLERIDQLTKTEGPFKNWTPADDPCEIVVDLSNALDDALAQAEAQARVVADDEIRMLFTKANMAAGYPEDDEDQGFDAQVGRAFIKARKKLAALLSGPTPKPAGVEIDDAMIERAALALQQVRYERLKKLWDTKGGSLLTDEPSGMRDDARAALTAALSGDAKPDTFFTNDGELDDGLATDVLTVLSGGSDAKADR